MPEDQAFSLWEWIGFVIAVGIPLAAGGLLGRGLSKMVERSQKREPWR